MKVISSILLGCLLVCGLCAAYLYYSWEGGEAVNPDKATPPDNAVVADDAATTEHKVMKPAVPPTDEQAEEKETTEPESGDAQPKSTDQDEPEDSDEPEGDSGG